MSTYDQVRELYEPTIGIECHVQLKTKTKLFSGADNDSRHKAANTTVSPICFGLPGILPVLNEEAITLSIRAGVALGSIIAPLSRFERKHYFYPDLPKGYQITQLAEPIIGPGAVTITLGNGTTQSVRIHHAHLEEDAGKLTHPTDAAFSLVDFNRAGTPLIEIVSEADMHSPTAAKAFATELYMLMIYADVTDGDLYHGNMRFDVNVSVAKKGEPWGTRTETKNLNSFRSVEKSAEYEIRRQIELLEHGQAIIQETRGWDEAKQKTISLRSKEDAHDYRYFPDADIPPVIITKERISKVTDLMPKLPHEYRDSWRSLSVDSSVFIALLAKRELAELVSNVLNASGPNEATRVANWCASTISTDLTGSFKIIGESSNFTELAQMAENSEINSTSAKELFNLLLIENFSPREEAKLRGLLHSNDMSHIDDIVTQVLGDPESSQAISDIRSGNDKAIGYLVGQAMKLSKGRANPEMLQVLIRKKLS